MPSTGSNALNRNRRFTLFRIFHLLGSRRGSLLNIFVKEHKVAVVPGSIFGKTGEGYMCACRLPQVSEQLKEGIARIQRGVEALMS